MSPQSPVQQPAPGAVFPLRVMAQDETFGAAFAVIRHAPRAALGLPFLAGLLIFALSMGFYALEPAAPLTRMATDPAAFEDAELAWAAATDAGMLSALMLLSFVTGLLWLGAFALLSIPVLRAAYGLPTTLGQAVRSRASRLGWLLLHLVLLSVLLAVLTVIAMILMALIVLATFGLGLLLAGPALLLLLCWVTAALMFGPVVIITEQRNAFTAIGRSLRLNRGSWWRHIGAVALLYLMLGLVYLIGSVPPLIMGGVAGAEAVDAPQGGAAMGLMIGAELWNSVMTALITAVLGCVICVMYLNARFRQEGLDAVLLSAAHEQDDAGAEALLPGSPEHLSAGGRPNVL